MAYDNTNPKRKRRARTRRNSRLRFGWGVPLLLQDVCTACGKSLYAEAARNGPPVDYDISEDGVDPRRQDGMPFLMPGGS